ncbi:hypothetical protein FQA47_003789 [Oryzias melastigma]|uniref:Uncharacterized protein n=1 Tax=Oryzias melastigma TaxID=30732 RepID=A0A834FDM2_ORYME|nr:hypothetical protein FQA47_003789 [Oryzias melastigma]
MAVIAELDLGGLALAENRRICSDRPDRSAVALPVSAVEQSESIGCFLFSDTAVSWKYAHESGCGRRCNKHRHKQCYWQISAVKTLDKKSGHRDRRDGGGASPPSRHPLPLVLSSALCF